MEFKIDENLPAELATDLGDSGHIADTVAQQGLAGADDAIIVEHVRSEKRVLLIMDKGIADVRDNPPEHYSGIVLFRLRSSGRGYVLSFVRRHLPDILEMDLSGRLLVVSEAGIRMR